MIATFTLCSADAIADIESEVQVREDDELNV